MFTKQNEPKREVLVIKTKSIQEILNKCYVIPKDNLSEEEIKVLNNINIKQFFTESEIERGYVFIRNIANKQVPEDVQQNIITDRKKGMTIRELVKKYSFSIGTIDKIVNNKYKK